MTRVRSIFAAWIVILTVGFTVATCATQDRAGPPTTPATPKSPTNARLQVAFSTLPLRFEGNLGQTDGTVQFISRGPGYTLWITATEAVLALRSAAEKNGASQTVLRMRLEGSNPAPLVSGLEPLPGKANYFLGNDPEQWRTNVPTYAKVKYEQVYSGVDLIYYGSQRQLEYDFVVAPEANPQAIGLSFEGADALAVDAHGDLVLRVDGGEFRLRQPMVYQEQDGMRRQIPGSYVLTDARQVSFQVAAYDTSRPLVIDPVLAYSTYLGGSGQDSGYAIAIDGAGNAYVTGSTGWSSDFPTKNALQSAPGNSTLGPGVFDAFVAKLDPGGRTLLYSTYLGGSRDDWGNGIAVDDAGNAYVTGETWSSDFPTANALQPAPGGGFNDSFVAKLDPTGSALVYSTYLGGGSTDVANGIAVNGAGNAYVTGTTDSTDFPAVNAVQPAFGGGASDAFVAKLNPTGSAFLYSTYLGGSSGDGARGIAVDSAGNAYLTGLTSSTDCPTLTSVPPARGEFGDAFVAKLDPTGSALLYSTCFGGSRSDGAYAIAVDGAGNAYVTGFTSSADFPTAHPFQASIGKATVYKSIDGGQSWSASGLSNLGVPALAIDRMNPSTVYAGTQHSGVFKSTDGGVSWTAVNTGLTDPAISDVAADPWTPSTLYAGTGDSGVFKSTDGGEFWRGIGPPVPGPLVRSVAVAPAVSTTLYAAVRSMVIKSLDGGETWNRGVWFQEVVFEVEIDPVVPSTLYASVMQGSPSDGGLYKSADGGATWSRITHSVASAVAIDPSNPSILYIGARGIFKTTDGGLNWVPMNNGLTDPDVSTLAIDTTDPSILYAGTGIGGVFKSSDGAGSWTTLNNGLDNPRVTALAIDPADPSTLYAGTLGGTSDAFLTKLDASGSSLVYSTYLGGEYYDEGHGVAVDSQGNAYVTGFTRSFHFPTANALQPNPPGGCSDASGCSDTFIAKFDPAGAALTYSTYLGGSDNDYALGIALDGAGNAYLTGGTRSSNFPTTAGAFDTTFNREQDAFVAKITEDTAPPTVTITAPTHLEAQAEIAIVSGSITVWADATDNLGVTGVQFQLDGAPLGAEDTGPPYAVTWDTTTTGIGPHTLTAVARDTAGNQGTAAPVSVIVVNLSLGL